MAFTAYVDLMRSTIASTFDADVAAQATAIPSAAQRIVIGGTPILGALRVLKDAKTGAVLAKLDQATATNAGNGLLGVAIEQALPEIEDRLLAQFVTQTRSWLSKK